MLHAGKAFLILGFALGAVACSTDPESFTAPIYYCEDPQAAQCSSSVEGAERWLDIEFGRAGDADTLGPFCTVVMRGRIGNDLHVVIARDRNRQSTAFTQNRAGVRVSSGGTATELNCVPEGADVFVKVCRYRASGAWARFWSELDACTSTYRVHLPNPEKETLRTTLRPQVQLDRVSCLAPETLGVKICYSWDDLMLIVKNPGDQAVRIKFDVLNRNSGELDLDSIPPHVIGLVSADDIQGGDVMRVSGWAADPNRSDADDNRDVPDWDTNFVMSVAPKVEADLQAIRHKFRLSPPTLRGAACTFIGQWFGDGASELKAVPETTHFRCVNQTGTDAKMSLYALARSGSGYVIDYFAGDMVANAGVIDDEVLTSLLLDGGAYLLTHKDTSWNVATDGGELFTVDFRANQVTNLDASLLLEPLP